MNLEVRDRNTIHGPQGVWSHLTLVKKKMFWICQIYKSDLKKDKAIATGHGLV